VALAVKEKVSGREISLGKAKVRWDKESGSLQTGQEGLVVRFTPVALVVETSEGEVIIPCQKLLDGAVRVQPVAAPAGQGGASAADDAQGEASRDEEASRPTSG